MDARLRFLTQSAQVYAGCVPSVSAQLMIQRNILAAEHSLNISGSCLQSTCNACGTILVSGRSCSTKIETQRRPVKNFVELRNKNQLLESSIKKYIVQECYSCRRTTKILLPPKPHHGEPKKSVRDRDTEASLNVSNPDRMKLRKERARAHRRGGLQALLAKSKEDTNPSIGFGLDLMDLMKKV